MPCQFPDVRGLQSTVLGQSLSFEATEPPLIQILHVGGNHWMTLYAIDNHLVKVYEQVNQRLCLTASSINVEVYVR